jgi:hypothetical protein
MGRRIELVSMDPHYEEISIGLYREEGAEGPEYRVHTYSSKAGAQERIENLKRAMEALGGLEQTPAGSLRFPCGAAHELGVRRIFLEACKWNPSGDAVARPLTQLDKKTGRTVTVSGTGGGSYEVTADGEEEGRERRIALIAGGLAKLGALELRAPDGVSFRCGVGHDALLALLLVRAPNVRAVLREQQAALSRGVLAAPSQQK